MILETIVAHKKQQLQKILKDYDIQKEIEKVEHQPQPPSFSQFMTRTPLGIIGEIKKASPSKGMIRKDFNPKDLAKQYEGIVDAISVLTEERFFQGSPQYLQDISEISSLPLLQKDFVIHPAQIVEGRKNGASCILIIAAITTEKQREEYVKLSKKLKMDVLVEVHTKQELEEVLPLENIWIGINNRDLHSFTVDLAITEKLMEWIPEDKKVISESGICTQEDVKRVAKAGVKGILVGESFMKAKDMKSLGEQFRAGAKEK